MAGARADGLNFMMPHRAIFYIPRKLILVSSFFSSPGPQTKRAARKQPFVGLAVRLAIEHVHRYFKAKTHFGVFRFRPHGKSSSWS